MNILERRIIELSYRHKLSHISSCLNTVNLLSRIYAERKENEPVVLGNGHAGLALYVCLEANGLCDAEDMIERHGVHPHRDMEHGVWVSSGSLGQAETVAVGLALADLTRKVRLVTSDGSCLEGAVAEAFRIAYRNCPNLQVHIVCNGYGAYGPIGPQDLPKTPYNTTFHAVGEQLPEFLQGLAGHYLQLTSGRYEELMK